MEKYVKAVQKSVIKDVIDDKDKIIGLTNELISVK